MAKRSPGNLRRCIVALLVPWLAALLALPALADPAGTAFNTKFVAIAFHDVTDAGEAPDVDSVTTSSLVNFFEWLKQDGWTPISVADVEAANQGRKSLPPKAILLSFDDGYASHYNRVYPLLLAYRYPAVLALVGAWMEQSPGTMVDYGGRPMPREHFVTWEQVRKMQASRLVEVASHSYDMHKVVPINRQGNTAPAARSWIYDKTSGTTETDADHKARIRADLQRSRSVIARETGAAPRVMVWSFGRYSGFALEEAKSAGFELTLTLEPARADARNPFEIPRYYPTRDPELETILDNLRFSPPNAPTIRVACVDLSPLAAARSADEQDAALGRMIEDLRRLGPNIAIIDAVKVDPASGRPTTSFVHTAFLPAEADILSRAARQLGTRAGVDVYVRLPVASLIDSIGEVGAIDLAQQAARAAPITGLALDGAGVSAGTVRRNLRPEDTRAVRAATLDGAPAAVRIMNAASAIDPQLRMMIIADGSDVEPPDAADMIVWQPTPSVHGARAQAAGLRERGWFKRGAAGRILLSVPSAGSKEQMQSIRAMQVEGATGVALCPWVPTDTPRLAPAFSSATFPRRP